MGKRRPEWRAEGPEPNDGAGSAAHGNPPAWDADAVRALRRHLGLTQAEMAQELGTRQATISEWEHGLYQPRGASARLLRLVAERAGFEYGDDES